MSEHILFTVGLPFGRWRDVVGPCLVSSGSHRLLDSSIETWLDDSLGAPPLAQVSVSALTGVKASAEALAKLQSTRPSGVSWWGGADARLCWLVPALAEACPQARFLVLVEHPARALSHLLSTDGDAADTARSVELVLAGVRALAQFVQRCTDRCLVLDVDEVSSDPALFASHLGEWLGISLIPTAVASDEPRSSALHALLGDRLFALTTGMPRLYERLFASCTPLRSDATVMPTAPAVQAVAAAEEFRSLVQQAARAEALGRRVDTARAERRGSTFAPDQCEREAELLLVQLHQVQEELEHYYTAWRDSPAATAMPATPAMAGVKVTRFDIDEARDVAPHRHLSMTLHGVEAVDRTLPRVDLRVVEHVGRPGIAFLASDGTTPPLLAWNPTGQEEARSFVLLVPADDPSRQRLMRLGCGDWRFLVSVVAQVARHLEQQSGTELVRWRNVASRLVRQLADLPTRFRFDRVVLDPKADASGAWHVRFENVSFADRAFERLALRWWPQDGAGIELLVQEDATFPPLASWPVEETGAWCKSWRIPLAGAPRADLERAWAGLTRVDRELLLGLLDAMPAVLPGAIAYKLVSNGGAEEIGRASSLSLRLGLRLAHGSRLKRAARALRNRAMP